MNRLNLIKKIEKLGFKFERHGGKHDIYKKGKIRVEVPRHKEVNERIARSLLKQ